MALAIFGFSIVAACGAIFTWLLVPLLDEAFITDDPGSVIWIPIVIAVLFLARSVGSYLGLYYIGKVGQLVVKKLRAEMHDTFSSKSLPILVRDSLSVLFALILMLYLSWKLTLVLLVFAPFVFSIVAYASRKFRRLSKKLQLSVGEITSRVEEIIGGHTIVKLFTSEQHEQELFERLNEKNRRNQTRIVATKAINTPLVQLILGFAFALVIYIAFIPSVKVDLTPGKFTGFVAAVMTLLSSAKKLTTVNEILQSGIAASISVFGLIDRAKQKDEGQGELPTCHGEVEFDNVSFAYSSDATEKALNEISLQARPGQMIALVGKSGSGKSTLVKLLPRFYDVENGVIKVDGMGVNTIKINQLRKQIAMVSQDIILFNDTIENNISYSMPEKSKEEIRDAARRAHALEFIENFPEGFDTMVGERGVTLSGGQKQRISIARALIKEPDIVILDDCLSAVDTTTEQQILGYLNGKLKDKTSLIITHRIYSSLQFDHIIVLEDGHIAEQGTHETLLAKGGYYAQVFEQQQLEEASKN